MYRAIIKRLGLFLSAGNLKHPEMLAQGRASTRRAAARQWKSDLASPKALIQNHLITVRRPGLLRWPAQACQEPPSPRDDRLLLPGP
jgi:hypothetical protein